MPKKLKLHGYDWKFIVTKDQNEQAGGSFDWKTKTIKINDKYGEYKVILLHEIIESVLVHNLVRYYGNEGNQEYRFIFNHTEFTKIICDIYQALEDNKLLK